MDKWWTTTHTNVASATIKYINEWICKLELIKIFGCVNCWDILNLNIITLKHQICMHTLSIHCRVKVHFLLLTGPMFSPLFKSFSCSLFFLLMSSYAGCAKWVHIHRAQIVFLPNRLTALIQKNRLCFHSWRLLCHRIVPIWRILIIHTKVM